MTKRVYPVRLSGFEHVDGALDVDARVVGGVGHGLADVDLGGEVEDRLRPGLLDCRVDGLGVADVELDEGRAVLDGLVEIGALAGGDVVD